MTNQEEVRGVLHYRRGRDNYDLTRIPPSPELALYVERYWLVAWDLRGREAQVQENIPHPSVHLVIEQDRCEVVGVVTRKYTRLLEGRGRVIGVKFRPGGFYPFVRRPVADLTDTAVHPEELFGERFAGLESEVLAAADHKAQVQRLEVFLKGCRPWELGCDAHIKETTAITAWVAAHREVVKVDQICDHFGISKRNLQRLFHKLVGISPKWIIKKYRLHEALALLEQGPVDWSALAHDLGYFDQAHFIKDFKNLIGTVPSAYQAAEDS